VIVAGFEGKATTVGWQVNALKDELKAAPVRDVTEFRGPACEPLWAALTGLQDRPGSRLTFKATVLPSWVGAFVAEAAAAHPDLLVHAHAGNGVVFGHVETAEHIASTMILPAVIAADCECQRAIVGAMRKGKTRPIARLLRTARNGIENTALNGERAPL
jgi:hypothetical protein